MITITNKKQYPSEQYLNELITNIEFAARAPVEVVRAMAAELQKRREADSAEPVAYIFKHPAGKLFWALTDESNKEQADVIPVYAAPPVPVVPEEKPMPNPLKMYAVDAVAAIAEVRGWNACAPPCFRVKESDMLLPQVTPCISIVTAASVRKVYIQCQTSVSI